MSFFFPYTWGLEKTLEKYCLDMSPSNDSGSCWK